MQIKQQLKDGRWNHKKLAKKTGMQVYAEFVLGGICPPPWFATPLQIILI